MPKPATTCALYAACLLVIVAIRASSAQAQPACAMLPNVVYLQIGDTQQPLIKELGRALRDNAPSPISLVYVTSGSCVNIAAIYNDTKVTTNMLYVPSFAEMPAWMPSMPALACTPPVGGASIDIANSNVFVSACDTSPVPAGIKADSGPIQAYVLAVPEVSAERAITAEEAYFTFGFGMLGMVTPWNDESQLQIRASTTSTLLSWAANIGVPVNKWKGQRLTSSTAVVDALRTSPTPDRAIGILGAEVYDRFRAELNALAFQAFGQYDAYFPDSTATALDKRNVRDGHYTVWSPTVYLSRTVAGGPASPLAAYVIALITGRAATPAPAFNPNLPIIHNGLVPDCAMGVKRTAEGGNLSLYAPTEPCACYYESQVATTTCRTCTTTPECAGTGGGVCRNNFCEER
jgi:hypothetical protein